MKSSAKELPVFGWSHITKGSAKKQTEENLINGKTIIYNTFKDIYDDVLCTYIIYDDTSKKGSIRVYLGWAKFIEKSVERIGPFAYFFHPMKMIDEEEILYCTRCGEPVTVILKDTDLELD